MAQINQARITSGFDVEVLLGANYFRMLIQAAVDSGLIPITFSEGGNAIVVHSAPGINRLYEARTVPPGSDVPASHDGFETEILFNDPNGANLRIRLKLEAGGFPGIPFELFVKITFDPALLIDGEARTVLLVEVVELGVDSSVLALIESMFGLTHADLLARLKQEVDRPIDLGPASNSKRVETIAIAWHEADSDHDAAMGIYVNTPLRNGDEETQFVAPRGDLANALNFLPTGEDLAMATRPGLYTDIAKDVFSRTALPNGFGGFDHILRKNLLSPTSKDIGLVHSISVGQATTPGTLPTPLNALRLRLKGEYRDPADLTLTDVTVTIEIKPVIKSDGTLTWDTDMDVDFDILFEFLTLWVGTLCFILGGPLGVGIFLGAAFVVQIGANIYLGERWDEKAAEEADATLADVIPDRLVVKSRRWDPFYSTKHQVVIKPSQAVFNHIGFMLCGKAFVGRELSPPEETVIRDDIRDDQDKIIALRYRIKDIDKLAKDREVEAFGRHDRPFDPPAAEEPDLFPLTLAQFGERATDPDGSLILHPIPYFIAYVHRENNTIRRVLVISGIELAELRAQHREDERTRLRAELTASDGPAIRAEVIEELTVNGVPPSHEDVEPEVLRRIELRVKEEIRGFEAPTPLDMVFSGELKKHVRWELTAVELFDLNKRDVIRLDLNVKFVTGPSGKVYIRDARDQGFESRDNLRQRPGYKPGPDGPIFL